VSGQAAPRTVRHFIGGRFVDSLSGRTFDGVSPIDNTVCATVAAGAPEDADRAVEAARRAFDEGPWPRMPAAERAKVLHRVADGIEARLEELAEWETRDMGKPLTEARTRDVPRAAHNFRFFADYAAHAHDKAFHAAAGMFTYTVREPAGVAALISPWNFPLMLATWKLAPALAFGCTAVLKPAEQSPVTASILAEICAEAGVPDGAVNVVQGFGPGAAGERLTTHPGVDLVSFTGESATGRAIMANAAPTLKKVSFELGGKSANIVFADADLDRAVAGSIDASFRNQGEVCLAGSRLLIQRPVYDEFLARFVEQAEALPVGNPLEERTRIGPLVSVEHRDKVLSYLELGRREGAKLLTGGRQVSDGELAGGNYLAPTVFADVDNSWRVAQEEIFGPVQVCTPFETEQEAVALANASRYGLAGMVWTQDLDTAYRVAGAVRAGTIWINCFFLRDLRAPFGGMKDSGIGREGGPYSEELFTEAKAVVTQHVP
jgi:aminomuconate-semialdehyde/2-hydroxymuconate-6-semialdehyde dehydrogenase